MNTSLVVKEFLGDISNGVSVRDVNLIEESVGENFISANINIKDITTERSTHNLKEIKRLTQEFLDDVKNDAVVVTQKEVLLNLEYMLNYFRILKKTITKIASTYSDDIRMKFVSSNLKYSYLNSNDGNVEKDVINIFEKDNNAFDIIFNNSLLESLIDESDMVEINSSIEVLKLLLGDNTYKMYSGPIKSLTLLNRLHGMNTYDWMEHGHINFDHISNEDLFKLFDDPSNIIKNIDEVIHSIMVARRYIVSEYFTGIEEMGIYNRLSDLGMVNYIKSVKDGYSYNVSNSKLNELTDNTFVITLFYINIVGMVFDKIKK